MRDLIIEVLDTAKRMHSEALVSGSSGNVSAYDASKDIMVITPSGTDYRAMIESDIVTMHLDGTVLSGNGLPSSEWRMHALLYKNRKDVQAVVHTHSAFATGFAVLHLPVPLILIEMVAFLGGDIPVAEFALPSTEELGQTALDALNDRFGCLLMNHGVLAVGESVSEAYLRAEYIEDAAKIYYNAYSIGYPHILSDDTAREMMEQYQ
jgi:L-ribulose-5-phosphate 4-epimerase